MIFDLLTFEDGDVGEFAEAGGAPVLDYQQTRLNIFDNEAETRDLARRSQM